MTTWHDFMPAYTANMISARRSPRTIELRTYQVERFFRNTGLDVHEVTLDHLRAYMGNPDWSANTAQVVKSSLAGFFRFCHEEELLPTNPAARLLSPKVPAGKPKPASDQALNDALEQATPRVHLMVTLGARVGLRAMEIAAVHTRDVETTQSGWILRVLGKGSKTRIVPIADDLARILTEREPGYIFPGRDNGHVSPAYVSRLVSKVLPPGVTAHKLRHRFATRALRNSGNNLRAVQELLGHSSIATTQIYTQIDNDELRRAALSASD